jgi:crotonobetainyl-CoA:carnitine CoA-transferase CaiB-like acyl-CoA transferase
VVDGNEARGTGETPLVVDLSALWAGPLCTRLLGALGARVVKVELEGRPDGARGGPPEFWDRLNGAKEQTTLDVSAIDRLLDGAAVVVTSARARAIEQLGLDLASRARDRGLVWVAITGYGYAGPWRDRVAFGDDAAVAGGLAVAAGGMDAPVFVGDAPADPLAGLTAAVAATAALVTGRGAFVDVSMCDAVARALSPSAHTGERYAAATAENSFTPR